MWTLKGVLLNFTNPYNETSRKLAMLCLTHCEKKVICTLRDGPADDCEAGGKFGQLEGWANRPVKSWALSSLAGKIFFTNDSPGWSFLMTDEVLDKFGGVAPNMLNWGR